MVIRYRKLKIKENRKNWKVAERLNAADCKSAPLRVRGFESLPSNKEIKKNKKEDETFNIYNYKMNIMKNFNNISVAGIAGGAGSIVQWLSYVM